MLNILPEKVLCIFQRQCFNTVMNPAVTNFDKIILPPCVMHFTISIPLCLLLSTCNKTSKFLQFSAIWFMLTSLAHGIIACVSYKSLNDIELLVSEKLSEYDYYQPMSKHNPRFSDESIFFYELRPESFNDDALTNMLGTLPNIQAQKNSSFFLLNLGMCIILSAVFLIILSKDKGQCESQTIDEEDDLA